MITPARSASNALHTALPISCETLHDLVERRGLDVLPLVDLGARHHQRVALSHRRDRQERDDVVVLVDESAGIPR